MWGSALLVAKEPAWQGSANKKSRHLATGLASAGRAAMGDTQQRSKAPAETRMREFTNKQNNRQ